MELPGAVVTACESFLHLDPGDSGNALRAACVLRADGPEDLAALFAGQVGDEIPEVLADGRGRALSGSAVVG